MDNKIFGMTGNGSKEEPLKVTEATKSASNGEVKRQPMPRAVKYFTVAVASICAVSVGCAIWYQQANQAHTAQKETDAALWGEIKQLKKQQIENAQIIKTLTEQVKPAQEIPALATVNDLEKRLSVVEPLVAQHAMALSKKSETEQKSVAETKVSKRNDKRKVINEYDEVAKPEKIIVTPKIIVNFTVESIDVINNEPSLVIKKNDQRSFVNVGDVVDGLRIVTADPHLNTVTIENSMGVRKTIRVSK